MNALSRADLWLQSKSLDETAKKAILTLKNNPTDLETAFGAPLDFGTGGIRKVMGLGSSLLNRYTIRMITEGLARALMKMRGDKPLKVIISYDTRYRSLEFAEECACTLAAHGITALIVKEPRPTPLLSFGCRHYKCDAGIMITASHNPKEYNGYKIYNEHGGQVISPWDQKIADEIAKIASPDEALTTDLSSDKIEWINEELDNAYLEKLEELHKSYHFKKGDLSIGYTPLHGTGYYLVPKALKHFQFNKLEIVTKQCTFDGSFPTVHVPNPEEEEALSLGKKLIEREKLDMLMATDPDADRLGVSVLHKDSSVDLNGNQLAQIMLYRILKAREPKSKKGFVVTTIVSTRMLEKIASHFGARCDYVLTGFKYIADEIEKEKELEFIFGAEESYGYLFGDFVRDKDAVGASVLLARIAGEIKSEGKTLLSELDELSSIFGVHVEKARSFALKGTSSLKESAKKWLDLTLQKCNALADKPIEVRDLSQGILGLPKSSGLWILFKDNLELVIRPSGTEPKVKLYVLINSKPCSIDQVPKVRKALEERADRLLEEIL